MKFGNQLDVFQFVTQQWRVFPLTNDDDEPVIADEQGDDEDERR